MPTTISDVIRDRAERGIADLLLSAYDAGYCHGAGIALDEPASPGLRELLSTLAMRHQSEVLALRQWTDPPVLADEIPGWLLAHAERQVLPAEPPEGWGVDGWPV
jgi:hypothetical protein